MKIELKKSHLWVQTSAWIPATQRSHFCFFKAFILIACSYIVKKKVNGRKWVFLSMLCYFLEASFSERTEEKKLCTRTFITLPLFIAVNAVVTKSHRNTGASALHYTVSGIIMQITLCKFAVEMKCLARSLSQGCRVLKGICLKARPLEKFVKLIDSGTGGEITKSART